MGLLGNGGGLLFALGRRPGACVSGDEERTLAEEEQAVGDGIEEIDLHKVEAGGDVKGDGEAEVGAAEGGFEGRRGEGRGDQSTGDVVDVDA
jgi:hypothetical protein